MANFFVFFGVYGVAIVFNQTIETLVPHAYATKKIEMTGHILNRSLFLWLIIFGCLAGGITQIVAFSEKQGWAQRHQQIGKAGGQKKKKQDFLRRTSLHAFIVSIFEFFKIAFKFNAVLSAVPPQGSFGPIFTKSFLLLDGGNKNGFNGYAQQKESKAADEHINQKKSLNMSFKKIHSG